VHGMTTQVLDRLNPLLEPGGVLLMSECGLVNGSPRVVRPHPAFRLFLVVDASHGEVSRAMRNRCLEVAFLPTTIANVALPSEVQWLHSGQVSMWDLVTLARHEGIVDWQVGACMVRAHQSVARLSTHLQLRVLVQWCRLTARLVGCGLHRLLPDGTIGVARLAFQHVYCGHGDLLRLFGEAGFDAVGSDSRAVPRWQHPLVWPLASPSVHHVVRDSQRYAAFASAGLWHFAVLQLARSAISTGPGACDATWLWGEGSPTSQLQSAMTSQCSVEAATHRDALVTLTPVVHAGGTGAGVDSDAGVAIAAPLLVTLASHDLTEHARSTDVQFRWAFVQNTARALNAVGGAGTVFTTAATVVGDQLTSLFHSVPATAFRQHLDGIVELCTQAPGGDAVRLLCEAVSVVYTDNEPLLQRLEAYARGCAQGTVDSHAEMERMLQRLRILSSLNSARVSALRQRQVEHQSGEAALALLSEEVRSCATACVFSAASA
jgi:hypothetical protein